MPRRTKGVWTLVALVTAVLLVAGTAPLVGFGADHLDAPGLTPPSARADADINDLFVFEGADADQTVIALTTGPAAGAIAPDTYGTDVAYRINVDTDADAVADIVYEMTATNGADGQQVVLTRNDGGEDVTVASGAAGKTLAVTGGGSFFAGLRSDPFFFDLGGFLGTVEGQGDRGLNDGDQSDFFESLNVLAMVLEVPDTALAPSIGVWGSTHLTDGTQIDRMGRPAINTVVNSSGPVVGAPSEAKNVYNAADPANDVADFTAGVVAALKAFSSLDSEGSYADAQAEALAAVLLPDVLAFDKSGTLPPPLNGRGLADDVIDTELNIVTGGDPLGLFEDRDAVGGVTTDSIGPHDDYLDVFPYLGYPNGVPRTETVGLVNPASGQWWLMNEAGAVTTFFYGDPGDVSFVGDWDCDGIDTPGIWRPSDGFVRLRNSNSTGIADVEIFAGIPGDIPIAGDFDGDGCDTVSIYRNGVVHVINTLATAVADFSYDFGIPGDIPATGDTDADGIDTVILRRESTGFAYLRDTNTSGVADREFFFGAPGDKLVVLDSNADGISTAGIFRPSDGTFYLRDTNTQGFADSVVPFPDADASWTPVGGAFGLG